MRSPFDAGHDAGSRVRQALGVRGTGTVLALMGTAAIGANAATWSSSRAYYPELLGIGIIVCSLGLWQAVTGREQSQPDNPLKWRVGFYTVMVGSFVAAGTLAFRLW